MKNLFGHKEEKREFLGSHVHIGGPDMQLTFMDERAQKVFKEDIDIQLRILATPGISEAVKEQANSAIEHMIYWYTQGKQEGVEIHG